MGIRVYINTWDSQKIKCILNKNFRSNQYQILKMVENEKKKNRLSFSYLREKYISINLLSIYLVLFQIVFTVLLGIFGSYNIDNVHSNKEDVPQLYASI